MRTGPTRSHRYHRGRLLPTDDPARSDAVPDRVLLDQLISRYPFGAIVVFDEDMRYTRLGGQGLDEVDLVPDDLVGLTVHEVWPQETAEVLADLYGTALEGGESSVEVPWAGNVYVVWAGPLPGDQPGGISFTFDVSARARAESELSLIRSAVAALDVGVSIADARQPDNPLIFVNRGFTRLTGYPRDEALGRNCRFLQGPETDPEPVADMRSAIDAGEPVQATLRNYREDGEPFWNRVTISPIRDGSGAVSHFVGIQEDVTHHRELGERLHVRERLAAVGQLAGGVAHDIRNVLTGVGGLLELALERDDVSAGLRDDLEQAGSVLERASSVAERLLVFSRGRALNPEPVELTAHLDRAAQIFNKMLRDDIAVRTAGPDRDVWILIDTGQLDQMILNLLKNAEDAMPAGGAVRVEVATGVDATDPFPELEPSDEERDWARVTVRDTGVGMDEATRSRALEPFFTTKGDGDGTGTGLGLATVFGAVTQSGGDVRIESSPDAGTAVHLLFPITDERPADREPAPAARTARGRILLVEDEAAVLQVVSRALGHAGHDVTAVEDGASAWDRFSDDADAFDLVITDAVMPGMSGIRLAREIRAVAPDTPIVIMTGYTEEELDEVDFGHVEYLEKPFKLDRLRGLVQRLLLESDG